jgi:hypothetical protein
VSWSDSLVVVAYPGEKRAFVIHQRSAPAVDMLFPSLAYQLVVQNLEDLGYTLQSHRSAGDTTLLLWRRPSAPTSPEFPASVAAKMVDERPVVVSSLDGRGAEVSRIVFASYRKVGPMEVPLVTTRSRGAGSQRVCEVTVLADPVWVEAFPPDALAPTITADYDVRNYDFEGSE